MAGPDVQVEVAPGHELVFSIAAAVGGSESARAIRAHAPALYQRVVDYAPSAWMWAHLVTVSYDAPPPRDAEALLARIDRSSAIDLQRRLVGYYVRWFRRFTPVEIMDAAIAGDVKAAATFVRTSAADDPAWGASLRSRLAAGPRASKRELLALAEAWYDEVFTPLIAPTLPALKRAVRTLRRKAGGAGAEDRLVRLAGWSFVADPGIARVVIVPSAVLGYELHEFDHGSVQFLCMGLAGATARAPAVSRHVLAVSRALADENRLRILKLLARGDGGAQELADELGVSLNTALHHLHALREAGLVGRGGRRQAYRLRRSRLAAYTRRLTEL